MSVLLNALDRLHEQVGRAWNETQKLVIPASYKSIDRIIVIGMGGSALGAHVVKTVFQKELKVPFEIVNGYSLPGSASKSSLILLSTYSGGTEEVLSAYHEAKKRGLKMLVMCAGGELARLARRDKVPGYIYDAGDLVPVSKKGVIQPRYATGFSIIGIVGMLAKIGLIRVSGSEIKALAVSLKKGVTNKHQAVALAKTLHNRLPIIVASEHLEGSAHIFANYCNETGKQLSSYYAIPELNHHLMEGLSFPKEIVSKTTFILLSSALYHPRIQKRYPLTAAVIQKNGAKVIARSVKAKTKLLQAFEVIQLAGYVTAEMARLYKVDPLDIPWVEWFKHRMK